MGQAVVGAFKVDSQDVLHVLDIASNRVLVADAAGTVGRRVDLPRGGAVASGARPMVVAEVRALPSRKIFFVDDNLIGHPGYAKELFAALAPLGRTWGGQASITLARDPELDALHPVRPQPDVGAALEGRKA